MNNAPYNQHLKRPTSILKTLRSRKNRTVLRQSTTSEAVTLFVSKRTADNKYQKLVSDGAPPVACVVKQSATPNHP